MSLPPGTDTTCRVCGEDKFPRPLVSIGHSNGKTFRYCKDCVSDPYRRACGTCGKFLWHGNVVMKDDGAYCSDCEPDLPLWTPPESDGGVPDEDFTEENEAPEDDRDPSPEAL